MLFDVDSIYQEESMDGLSVGRSLVILETNGLLYEEQEGVYFTKDFCINQGYFVKEIPQMLQWTTRWLEAASGFSVGINNIVITSIYDLHWTPWKAR